MGLFDPATFPVSLRQPGLDPDLPVLLVPDRAPTPDHWLSRLAATDDRCRVVDLGMWEQPHRNTWVTKLNLAIERANTPVAIIAEGLGCVALAWWAEFEQPQPGFPVAGALLVNPPDVDRPGADPRLARFTSCPRGELPFRSVLAVDPARSSAHHATLRGLARDWGSSLVLAEPEGLASFTRHLATLAPNRETSAHAA